MPWIPKRTAPRWFDITALLDPSVAAAASGVRVRRNGDRIEFMVNELRFSRGGILLPWGALPPGYRPTISQYGHLGTQAGVSAEITANTGGGLVVGAISSGQTYRGNFIVWTTAAPPTSHPGTEVS